MTFHFQVTLIAMCSSIIVSADQMLRRLPLGCIEDWKPSANLPRLSSDEVWTLCMHQKKQANCKGVRCPSDTCEAMSEFNFTQYCLGPWRHHNPGLFLPNVSITNVSQEVHMIVPTQGELRPFLMSNISSIPMPPLTGLWMIVQFEDGILSCAHYGNKCRLWVLGSRAWLPFSAVKHLHTDGALHVLGGKPFVVGGSSSGTGSKDKTEIYNGIEWVDGPGLLQARRDFGSALIRGVALVVVGGYDAGTSTTLSSVEIIHADKMIWEQLADFPLKRKKLACGHVKLEKRDHVLCSGGDFNSHYQSFSLDMTRSDSSWEHQTYLDTPEAFSRGFIFQWDHFLYYFPLEGHVPPPWLRYSRVYKLDLAATNPTWVNMELFPTDDAFICTAVIFVTRYTITLT